MTEIMANRLKAYRKLTGMSQKELARKSGVSVWTVNHIEQGGDTSLKTLEKIETGLGMRLF